MALCFDATCEGPLVEFARRRPRGPTQCESLRAWPWFGPWLPGGRCKPPGPPWPPDYLVLVGSGGPKTHCDEENHPLLLSPFLTW
eukprot:7677403-Pyramimonas_sp.AAC.1